MAGSLRIVTPAERRSKGTGGRSFRMLTVTAVVYGAPQARATTATRSARYSSNSTWGPLSTAATACVTDP